MEHSNRANVDDAAAIAGGYLAPQVVTVPPYIEDFLRALLYEHRENAVKSSQFLLVSAYAGVVGAFLSKTEFELLNSAAQLARDPERYERLLNYDGDVNTMSFEEVFSGI